MALAFSIRSHPPARHAGLVLPLALSAALVLLLSSLSISAAALQAQRQHGAALRRQQAEDQLASTAHQHAAALQGPYRCLLNVPSTEWQRAAKQPPCRAGLDPHQLLEPAPGADAVLLRHWQPNGSGSGGELRLQRGESGLQKRYALNLLPGEGLLEVG